MGVWGFGGLGAAEAEAECWSDGVLEAGTVSALRGESSEFGVWADEVSGFGCRVDEVSGFRFRVLEVSGFRFRVSGQNRK